MTLTVQTASTAPADAQPLLESAQATLGFVPNLFGVLANSPLALEAYTSLSEQIAKSSTLSATEQQIALIATSIENGCDYCVAAHTTIAASQRVDEQVLERVRSKTPLEDSRLEVLRTTAIAIVRERGWLSNSQRQQFLDAGYTPAQLLELITLNALKTISNYTNHVADTPLDAAFEPRRFSSAA